MGIVMSGLLVMLTRGPSGIASDIGSAGDGAVCMAGLLRSCGLQDQGKPVEPSYGLLAWELKVVSASDSERAAFSCTVVHSRATDPRSV